MSIKGKCQKCEAPFWQSGITDPKELDELCTDCEDKEKVRANLGSLDESGQMPLIAHGA